MERTFRGYIECVIGPKDERNLNVYRALTRASLFFHSRSVFTYFYEPSCIIQGFFWRGGGGALWLYRAKTYHDAAIIPFLLEFVTPTVLGE